MEHLQPVISEIVERLTELMETGSIESRELFEKNCDPKHLAEKHNVSHIAAREIMLCVLIILELRMTGEGVIFGYVQQRAIQRNPVIKISEETFELVIAGLGRMEEYEIIPKWVPEMHEMIKLADFLSSRQGDLLDEE